LLKGFTGMRLDTIISLYQRVGVMDTCAGNDVQRFYCQAIQNMHSLSWPDDNVTTSWQVYWFSKKAQWRISLRSVQDVRVTALFL